MRETPVRTIGVAAALCVVCSVAVAAAASVLRDRQKLNRQLDFQRNVLVSAGMIPVDGRGVDAKRIQELFQSIEARVVDLTTGQFVEHKGFEQEKADKEPELVEELGQRDVAGIRRRSKLQTVYLVKKDGVLDQVVLRVYGRGLWSTMYGFLALDKDTVTVRGLNFYSHGETPGLGGEIDNPNWKAQWPGKKVYSTEYKPAVLVSKTRLPESDPRSTHQVDALSGATITSVGVQNSIRFWLSDDGYGKFLARVRRGEVQ